MKWIYGFINRNHRFVKIYAVLLLAYGVLDLALLAGMKTFLDGLNKTTESWMWIPLFVAVLILKWRIGVVKDNSLLNQIVAEDEFLRKEVLKQKEPQNSWSLIEKLEVAIKSFWNYAQGLVHLVLFFPVFWFLSWQFSLALFTGFVPVYFLLQKKMAKHLAQPNSYLKEKSLLENKMVAWIAFRNKWTIKEDITEWRTSLDNHIFLHKHLFKTFQFPFIKWQHAQEALSAFFVLGILGLSYFFIRAGIIESSTLILYCGALLLSYKPIQQAIRAKVFIQQYEMIFKDFSKNSLFDHSETLTHKGDSLYLEKVDFGYAHRIYNKVSHDFGSSHWIIVGGNGMGKSTMLKLLAGILKPSSGKVVHPRAYQKIGYLDQIPEIPQYQSFWEKRLKRNDFWVDTLGVDVLVNKWKEFPDGKSFSIGQRQKLALALVLSSQSNLLLLDEPVSAIPQAERKPFLKNLSNWASANQIQLVVVSHDLAPNYQVLRMEKEREPS